MYLLLLMYPQWRLLLDYCWTWWILLMVHIWRCILPTGPYLFQDVMISLLTPPHLETLFMFQELVVFRWIYCFIVMQGSPLNDRSWFIRTISGIWPHVLVGEISIFLPSLMQSLLTMDDSTDDSWHISINLFLPHNDGDPFWMYCTQQLCDQIRLVPEATFTKLCNCVGVGDMAFRGGLYLHYMAHV